MEPATSVPEGNYTPALSEFFPRVNKTRLVESGIESKDTLSILPSNATASLAVAENFLEFRIKGCSAYYLDLSSIKLELKGTCVKDADAALEAADHAVLVDNSLHGLFKSVSVALNGKQLENNTMYPLISHMRIMTESSPHKADTFLANAGYWGNSHTYNDVTTWPESLNTYSAKQKAGVMHWCGPLILDLGTIDGYLLDNVDLTIRLEYASANFVLSTNKPDINPRFKISSAKIYIDRLKPYVSAIQALNRAIEKQPMSYIYNKTLVKTFMLTKDSKTVSIDAPFQSHVPGKILIALLSMDAYSGNYKKNGLYIDNCQMTKMGVTVNNRSIYNLSCVPYEDNAMLYDACIRSIGLDTNHLLTKEKFREGCSIVCLDLVPERIEDAVPLDISGHLKIDMDFSNIQENVLCCIIGDTNGVLYVDQYRNVNTDAYT